MEFLAASQALIAAGLTVPALLALYFLRLRRRPVRVSTILFWPAATEDAQANTPLRWPRMSWLLLLHLLALACLLVAFARPVVPGTDGPGGRVVLLLDASASMSAMDEGETATRLERARQRAKRLVRELRGAGGDSFCVVMMAARARPLTSFTASVSVLDAAIDSIPATDQPADLAAALALVDALGSGAGEDDTPQSAPTVYLLSDGSFAGEKRPPAIGARLRFERVGPRGSEPNNVGIVKIAARRAQHDATLVRVTAELMSTDDAGVDVPVSLSLDGEEISREAVRLEAGSVEGGGSRGGLMRSVRVPGAGVLTLTVNRQDALASDNAASVVMRAPRAPSLALVRERPASERLSPASLMLDDVLEELAPGRVTEFTRAQWESAAGTPQRTRFDMIVFDGTTPSALPSAPTLTIGAVPPVPGLRGAGTTPLRPDSIFWRRDHVLLRGVTLDSLVVTKAILLEPEPQNTDPSRRTPQLDAAARSDDAPILALLRDGPRQHAIVAFDLQDSNWPLTPSFAVFLANVVDELTLRERSEEGRAFTTSEPVTVRAPSVGGLALDGPSRVEVRPEQTSSATDERAEVQVGPVERAGLYFVRAKEVAGFDPDRVVAVNLCDQTESLLASPEQVRVEGKPLEDFQAARTPREVWHWFVLAACVLLMVEWGVSARELRA